MIVSLRGTNGAGKSTIVRKIMALYAVEHEVFEPGRRKPICTMLRNGSAFELLVPGHYEIANGGVDTLPSLDVAYTLIETAASTKVHVLYEGKNMSDGPRRLIELKEKGYPVHVLAIKISTEDAVKSVRKRGHSIKKETVAKLNAKTEKDVETFKKAGVPVYYGSRTTVLKRARELLGV